MRCSMYTKFFVALTFSESTASRKIHGFRKRFDPKFNEHVEPHMSMLAPFEIHRKDRSELLESLKDEIDNFFVGCEDTPKLQFKGLDVYRHRRKNILYLNPDLGDDLGYCLEGVQQLCESFIPPEVNYKQNAKQFLPLGHFTQDFQLHKVLEIAKQEFPNSGDLFLSGISIYEKRFGIWIEVEQLISFENPNDNFLQLQHASI